MRPLLSHASVASREGTDRQRRVIHLEFAACSVLPESYRWKWFVGL